jgi:hypothetical protein
MMAALREGKDVMAVVDTTLCKSVIDALFNG